MNQVALVGNITDDSDLGYAQSGAALAGFTDAASHRSKTNGEWQDVNDGLILRLRSLPRPRRQQQRPLAALLEDFPGPAQRVWIVDDLRTRRRIIAAEHQVGRLSQHVYV